MSILSKIFGKPINTDQVEFIRNFVGKEIKREDETFDCNSITDEVLMGLPEATVITVINSYFDFKRQNPNLSEKEVFEKIMQERFFSNKIITKILDDKLDLLQLINISLEHLDQSGFMSDSQILAYIEKYIQIPRVLMNPMVTIHEAAVQGDKDVIKVLKGHGAEKSSNAIGYGVAFALFLIIVLIYIFF